MRIVRAGVWEWERGTSVEWDQCRSVGMGAGHELGTGLVCGAGVWEWE